MNSSPASSYAFASSSSTRSARRAVISPMRYVSILTPASSIAASTPVSGSSTVAVELLDAALARARAQQRPSRRRGAAAWRTSAAVSSSAAGSGRSSTPYSAARSSSSYVGAARLDQVGGEQRVVDARRARSALASCATSSAPCDSRSGRRRRRRPRPPVASATRSPVGRDRRARPERGDRGSSRHGTATPSTTRRGAAGTRLVELVDAAAAGRGTRSGGTSPSAASGRAARARAAAGSQSRSRSRRIVASSFDGARLVGVLGDRSCGAPGESSSACSITSSSEPYCAISWPAVLSPMPGMPGMLSEVSPLSPMKSGIWSGRDAVAGLDALGRVDVDVGDAARRHHQADVVGDELEGVAVGRDDASS